MSYEDGEESKDRDDRALTVLTMLGSTVGLVRRYRVLVPGMAGVGKVELAVGVRYGAGGSERGFAMLTITITVDAPLGQAIAIKEALGMYLEQYGDTRVVAVVETGLEQMRMGEI